MELGKKSEAINEFLNRIYLVCLTGVQPSGWIDRTSIYSVKFEFGEKYRNQNTIAALQIMAGWPSPNPPYITETLMFKAMAKQNSTPYKNYKENINFAPNFKNNG